MKRKLWILVMLVIAVAAFRAADNASVPPGGCEAVTCSSVQNDCNWTCTVCAPQVPGGGRLCGPQP